MLDKNFLQSFLKVNNASEHMSDNEVRGVLSRAGWTQSEADAALALLRSGARGATNAMLIPQMASGSPTYDPNMEFSSAQLSSLLGVDVEVDPQHVRKHHFVSMRDPRALRETLAHAAFATLVVMLSGGIALGVGMGFFYLLEIGPFRP